MAVLTVFSSARARFVRGLGSGAEGGQGCRGRVSQPRAFSLSSVSLTRGACETHLCVFLVLPNLVSLCGVACSPCRAGRTGHSVSLSERGLDSGLGQCSLLSLESSPEGLVRCPSLEESEHSSASCPLWGLSQTVESKVRGRFTALA